MLQLLVGIHYLLFCFAAPVSSKTVYHQRSAARAISIFGYNTCDHFILAFVSAICMFFLLSELSSTSPVTVVVRLRWIYFSLKQPRL